MLRGAIFLIIVIPIFGQALICSRAKLGAKIGRRGWSKTFTTPAEKLRRTSLLKTKLIPSDSGNGHEFLVY